MESDLIRSEAKVKGLERKLRYCNHSEDFLQSQQQKVMRFDELERKVQHLEEENLSLKRQQDNVDLLRYKVQTLQERCAKYEAIDEKVAQLEFENKELKEKVAAGLVLPESESGQAVAAADTGSSAPASLWYKIAQLQQREILLTVELGEMKTRSVHVPVLSMAMNCVDLCITMPSITILLV